MPERSGASRAATALLAVMLAVTACGDGDGTGGETSAPPSVAESATQPPAGSPAPTSAPSPDGTEAAATPEPSSTAGTDEPTVVLEPDTIAEVIITELVVRSKPHVGDDSEIFEPILGEGQRLLVLDGPESASGYWWYLVWPLTETDGDARLPSGWVASSDRDGEPWLEGTEPECPSDTSDVVTIAELRPEERLVCFGGEDVTFTGEQRGCGIISPATIEPGWFSNFSCGFGPPEGPNLAVRFPPEVGEGGSMNAGTYEVTGHFDDPRAQDCQWINSDQPEPTPEEVVVMCRLEFVVVATESAS